MERLTNRDIEIPSPYWLRVHMKLAAYEDIEEHGLLVRLPCKVGDMVYLIDSYSGLYFSGVATMRVDSLATVVRWVETGAIGRTVFLSEEEAKAALAKES